MYYYIFDPPKAPKAYEQIAQVKKLVASLGIAGEMTSPQPGRSVLELVDAALRKRYSTIVTVGGSDLVNQVASLLADQDVVLGIVPLFDHPDIHTLLETKGWPSAVNALKRRRWVSTRLGSIGNDCFLTPATAEFPLDADFSIQTHSYSFQGIGGTVRMSTDPDGEGTSLTVEVIPPVETTGFWSRFRRSEAIFTPTRVDVPWLGLDSTHPVSVMVGGEPVSTLPVRARPGGILKLIRGSQLTA